MNRLNMIVCPECGQINLVDDRRRKHICPVCACMVGISESISVELSGRYE